MISLFVFDVKYAVDGQANWHKFPGKQKTQSITKLTLPATNHSPFVLLKPRTKP